MQALQLVHYTLSRFHSLSLIETIIPILQIGRLRSVYVFFSVEFLPISFEIVMSQLLLLCEKLPHNLARKNNHFFFHIYTFHETKSRQGLEGRVCLYSTVSESSARSSWWLRMTLWLKSEITWSIFTQVWQFMMAIGWVLRWNCRLQPLLHVAWASP